VEASSSAFDPYRVQAVVTDRPDLGAALALGVGGGLRAFAPAVALAVHRRGPFAGRARFIAFGAAAVGAAFAGSLLRVKVDGRGRQLVAAAAEDALSYSLVLTARSSSD
jgi:hypothetical protein